MPLGLYISVPFCRTKCSYCNFASDVFSRAMFQRYVYRVGFDLDHAAETATSLNGQFESVVDSIFLGGGTPTVLETDQFEALFAGIARKFQRQPGAEVTIECAPGTLTPGLLEVFQRCGVNRVSLGVQSFVDQEAASVGRVHKGSTVADDIRRLRQAGIFNVSVDLIAGLPHQTAESWEFSVEQAIASGVPHVSVYMLEVDEDSRLGREVLAGGSRYHAHFVPDDDLTADFYLAACERLNATGVQQYEISNFARAGFESKHNLKYWTRQPYLGFGVDAHSMLKSTAPDADAVRLATADALEKYVAGVPLQKTPVSRHDALEESFFLGLRLNRGVDVREIAAGFGHEVIDKLWPSIRELIADGLLLQDRNSIRLTPHGRLLSNEVFQAFLAPIPVATNDPHTNHVAADAFVRPLAR